MQRINQFGKREKKLLQNWPKPGEDIYKKVDFPTQKKLLAWPLGTET